MIASLARSAAIAALAVLPACERAAERSGTFATSDGTRLAWERLGSGDQVLVVPMRLYLSEPLAPLAEGRTVVFYDPRGRGASDAADTSSVSLDRAVLDLEELRAGLGIERMALLGWSGLGMEMAVYAMRYAPRVTRLVQLSPVPPAQAIMREAGGDARVTRTDTAALRQLYERFDAGAYANDPKRFCQEERRLTLPSNFADTSLVSRVADVCEYPNEWPVNLWPYFGALLGSFGDYDWRDSLRTLAVPRLVLHGREDGIPLAGARAWVSGYPTARLIELSPAGHFPFIEQREQVLAAIDEFLRGRWPAAAVADSAQPNSALHSR